jgi:hypothetical protein
MQWNARGALAHINELRHYLSTLKFLPDIICIQETFLKPRNSFNIQNYITIRKDRINGERGGVLILVKTGINYRLIKMKDEIENITVEVVISNKIYNISSVYFPPTQDILAADICPMFQLKNSVIIGDMNAHNPLWKSDSLNTKGEILETLIEQYNFVVCNTGVGTYQKAMGGTSILDLCLVSSAISLDCNWSALNTTLGSDHFPTFIVFNEQNLHNNGRREKFNCKKADWLKYKEMCIENITVDIETDDINTFNSNLINKIKLAGNASIPKMGKNKTGKINTKQLPYWTAECSNAVKLRNTARNKFNKTKNAGDGEKYRKLKGIAQKTIKETAKQHWQSLCSSFDNNTKLGAVWKLAKKMQGKTSQFSIPTLNQNITDDRDKANVFARNFVKNSDDENYDKTFLAHKNDFEKLNVADFTNSLNGGQINSQ